MKKVKTGKVTSLYKNPYSLLNQVIKKKNSTNLASSVPKSARPYGLAPKEKKK